MDFLTNWVLTNFTFFASGLGILLIGTIALILILIWDWRVTLVGLLVMQIGVVVLSHQVHGLPLEWANVQLMVTALVAAMLSLSARQIGRTLWEQRPGSWLIRLGAVVLLIVGWQFVEVDLVLPQLAPQVADLFFWLALCAFVLLGLSGSPFYTGVALVIWFMPVQAFIQVLLPDQRLFVLIAMSELFVGLACSYLLLAQRLPEQEQQVVLTDAVFPEEKRRLALPSPSWGPKLPINGGERRSNQVSPDYTVQPNSILPPRDQIIPTQYEQDTHSHPQSQGISPQVDTTGDSARISRRSS